MQIDREAHRRSVADAVGRARVGARPQAVDATPAIPELHDAALIGLAGDIVNTLAPETEAHRAALLAGFLVMFGNAVGAGPHVRIGGDQHGCRLHVAIVGTSSRARKGTAASLVAKVMSAADPNWAATRIFGGFQSGEALIDAVADTPAAVGGRDHRLLVREPEFARVLTVANREGNVLGHILRETWDGGRLSTHSRSRGDVTATGAHISVLADITIEELRRSLTSTMAANGFANRYLYVLVHRSRRLPSGGNLPETLFGELGARVAAVLRHARRVGVLARDREADHGWARVYNAIPDDEVGLYGAIVARSEAHVLRLAVTYALLDRTNVVTLDHLRAACAICDYSRASAASIFGRAPGTPYAERLYDALVRAGDDGLSREQQMNVFSRHISASDLDGVASELVARGRAVEVKQETGGAPARRLFAAQEAQEAWKIPTLLTVLDDPDPPLPPLLPLARHRQH